MSMLQPFIGSPQSRYAGLAILVAVFAVSLAILFGADVMPLSQKFFFILLIFLLSTPGILLSLLQLTCLVTGAGNNRWWCSAYSWLMSLFVIFYSILVVVIAVKMFFQNKETYTAIQRYGRRDSNNIIKDYPAEYPPNATPAPQQYPTLADTESGLPTTDDSDKNQYMIRQPTNERFLGMADESVFGGESVNNTATVMMSPAKKI